MSGNGNGKGNPKLVEAKHALDEAQRPLKELDGRIAQLQQQLTTAQQAATAASQERDAAGQDFVDEKPNARKRLMDAGAAHAEATAKAQALQVRLDKLVAQRPSLDAACQAAAVALGTLVVDTQLAEAEEEWSKARWHQAQAEEALVQAQKRTNEAADRFRLLSQQKRDSAWAQQRAQANADFRKLNPTPGHEIVRRGF